MAEQFMYICDSCFSEYKDVLRIERKKSCKEEECAFCKRKKSCKYSKVTYGKDR